MLLIKRNKGFEWFNKNGIFLKGYFYIDGKYKTLEEVADYLADIISREDFKNRLAKLDGGFSVIVQKDSVTYACVDRVRSIPLFYSDKFGSVISDDVEAIIKDDNYALLDNNAMKEFESIGCTIEGATLIDSVNQLQGGQFLTVQNGKFSIEYYFRHFHTNPAFSDVGNIASKMTTISNDMFLRLIDSCRGKKIVVPLSGGYDSRYIVAMLKKLGVENVTCYTYGKRDSFEVSKHLNTKIAENVAKNGWWSNIKEHSKAARPILAISSIQAPQQEPCVVFYFSGLRRGFEQV